MKYFNTKDFQKGYATYSFFFNKLQYSENEKSNKSFFTEVSGDLSAIEKYKSFAIVDFGTNFAYNEAVETVYMISSIAENVRSGINKIEQLLKQHDPYCQMILVTNNSLRKVLDKRSVVDRGRMFFAGRELLFIEHIKLDGKVLAFEPSSFVISQEVEEYEKEERLFIKKKMGLNIIDKSKKILMIDVEMKAME